MSDTSRLAAPEPGDRAAALIDAIEGRRAVVGVVGLGYVGVPLALGFCGAGFRVVGFDVSPGRVADLNAGRQVISYLPADAVSGAVGRGLLEASDDFSRLREPDALLICVPTPLADSGEPDLSFVVQTVEEIARNLRAGQIVVLESTTWPGTTREVVQPALERSGLVCGRDFFLAYSPEREDPGNRDFGTRTIPKVVGADDPISLRLALALYRGVIARTVEVTNSRTAEAVKLSENVFRAVNIALVNELKLVYEAMAIDIWEVIDAAATKPFGFMPFYPGPGLGGHCVPIDPFYLSWKARELGMETRFIELAGRINRRMPEVVVDRLTQALAGERADGIVGARVLILGIAYKPNVNDTRESPSLVLIELIEQRGGRCDVHDPLLDSIPVTREHLELAGRRSIELTAENLAAYDAVLIATDHDAVDYALIAAHARLIVDTRNALARRGLAGSNLVRA